MEKASKKVQMLSISIVSVIGTADRVKIKFKFSIN